MHCDGRNSYVCSWWNVETGDGGLFLVLRILVG